MIKRVEKKTAMRRRLPAIYLIAAIVVTFFTSMTGRAQTNSSDSIISPSDSIISRPDTVISPSDPSPAIEADSRLTQQQLDSAWRHDHYWTTLLRKGKLNMQDTTVIYPKFIGFCVKVYNWGDRVFNSYDTDYVEGTGKRWKARFANDNWLDSYALRFPESKMSMRMMNELYSNLGAYIHYMAVSIGYSINLNHAIAGKPIDQRRFDFSFNCARFCLDLAYSENTGGSYMRTFGDYRDGHLFKSYFPGLEQHTFSCDLYYFFNNRKYSQGAAYNFSRLQRKSAGSFILGLNYSNQDISLDFSTLDPKLLPYLKINTYFLKIHYSNYCLLFGYGYNWAITRNLLYNISAMPSIGFNRCFEDSADGATTLLSLNIKGRMSLTYNYRSLFMGLIARMDGHWYRSPRHSLFNSIATFSANVGVRF